MRKYINPISCGNGGSIYRKEIVITFCRYFFYGFRCSHSKPLEAGAVGEDIELVQDDYKNGK